MKRYYRNFVTAKWAVFYGVAFLLALYADAWCWLTFILTWIASAWVERYDDMLKMAKVIDLLGVTQEQADELRARVRAAAERRRRQEHEQE